MCFVSIFVAFFRRIVPWLIIGIPLISFTSSLAKPRYTLSGSPVSIPSATHLVFVSYPESQGEELGLEPTHSLTETEVTVWAYPMIPDGLLGDGAIALFSQPDSPDCQTDSLHPSPDNHFLIIQYNCQHHLTLQLLNLENLPSYYPNRPIATSSVGHTMGNGLFTANQMPRQCI